MFYIGIAVFVLSLMIGYYAIYLYDFQKTEDFFTSLFFLVVGSFVIALVYPLAVPVLGFLYFATYFKFRKENPNQSFLKEVVGTIVEKLRNM